MIVEFENTSGQSSITHYIWNLDISGIPQEAGGVGGLVAVCKGGEWYIPLYDANGNITEYVNTNGTIVAQYDYDAFGRTVYKAGLMADEFRYRFSTKYYDDETGFYYYGYRYYYPEWGRWISRDPIEEEGGMNLYGFVGNDGVNEWDYLGLSWWNPLSWFKKKACCDENPIDTGVGICIDRSRWPINPRFISQPINLNHAWITLDGVGYGQYPYWIAGKGGNREFSEEKKGRENEGRTTCTAVTLSPCEYDTSKFRECVAGDIERRKVKDSFIWWLGNNCLDFVNDLVAKCKRESKIKEK